MTVREELSEQPRTVRRLLELGGDDAAAIAEMLRAPGVDHVVVAARGTSDNAARYAQYVWGGRNGVAVSLATPSLFGTYGGGVDLSGAAVLVISQSGQSPDLLAVAGAARRQGRPLAAITNDVDSPLAEAVDHVLDLRAGPEHAVAATKTYTASLTAVAMVSDRMAAAVEGLDALPALLEEATTLAGPEELSAELADADRCIVLGRGWHLATAHEWALKLQELTGVIAQPWSTADFEHGPIAAVGEGMPVFAVSVRDATHASTSTLLRRLTHERGARTILVTDEDDPGVARRTLVAPMGEAPWLSPIAVAPLIQRHAVAVAETRGLDPDSPRALRKVTRTL